MYRIIYMSSSVKLLEENEIDLLLRHSIKSNNKMILLEFCFI